MKVLSVFFCALDNMLLLSFNQILYDPLIIVRLIIFHT